MAAFLHPGVYVLETPSPARSIEGASTSTAIFVGDTERGPTTPTRVTSRTDFTRLYGGYMRSDTGASGYSPTLAYTMDAFFGNGGTDCYVLRAMSSASTAATASRTIAPTPPATGPSFKVVASSPGVWANAPATGTPAGVYVVTLPSTDADTQKFRVVVIHVNPDQAVTNPPSSPQIVEDWDRLSTSPNDENYVVDVLKRSAFIRYDETVATAAPPALDGVSGLSAAQILALVGVATGLAGGQGGATTAQASEYQLSLLDDLDDASLLILGVNVKDDSLIPALNSAGLSYVQTRPLRDLFMVGNLQRHGGLSLASLATDAVITEFDGLTRSDFAAHYFPWVFVSDPVGVGKDPLIAVGPAGVMTGVYARTDALRGVWKAPAGVEATLLGVRKLEYNILDINQDRLNPKGINALRLQPGAGPVAWGARTMRPNSEWRYINVRRMAIFLRKSIYNGIQFAVFEGNDEPLWAALRLTIGGFMDSLYRQGAFAGGSPSEAYFVKCDSETTTPTDQLAGVVNVLVGFSPLRPAEFVVVKLSQIVKSGG